jgi:hypothetical protein
LKFENAGLGPRFCFWLDFAEALDGSWTLFLTRFLDANRYPLRSKTLRPAVAAILADAFRALPGYL